MGKRSDYDRIPQDRYDTPAKAVRPLLPFLPDGATYYEPCYGHGALVRALPVRCVGHSDSELDARTTRYETDADFFVTNPPWRRDLLHPIVENLRRQKPTWLLLDADWMFTRQASRLLAYCERIVAVGRLIWMPGTGVSGKDNAAWYLFGRDPATTVFHGRSGDQADLFDGVISEIFRHRGALT